MINCNDLYRIFKKNDLIFFAGVPDSTFKDWMKYLADSDGEKLTNRVAVIERDAVGLAAGYYLATQKIGVVYMQNSGLGNAINPITSLADSEVYKIPMILMIGWRGEPEKKDEPQHKKIGRIMLPLLDILEIPYKVLPENIEEAEKIITEVKNIAERGSRPVALIIKKGILEEYNAQKEVKLNYEMKREDAIKIIIDNLSGSEVIVSTTGKNSRELFEYREEKNFGHQNDFLMIGSMGEASVIGAEIALQKPNKKIVIFDGDGAAMMTMGAMATIGNYHPKNLSHIIFDNGTYGSTGGQPTFSENVDFEKVALACDYDGARTVKTKKDLKQVIGDLKNQKGPQIVIVKINKGARKDLGRPTTTPIENKKAFMNFLRK
ncbi:phosphonopyruvate decarboxylase [Candidatus Pacearchaeota archaeon]|nr:phosphonopyruvate decarboxylase [Candidatus Pacearchaeota archaeon]